MSGGSFKKFLFTTTLLTATFMGMSNGFAQTGGYYGGNDGPSVEVNLDVLDDVPAYNNTAPLQLYNPQPSYDSYGDTAIESSPVAPPQGFENRNTAPVVISSQTVNTAPALAAPIVSSPVQPAVRSIPVSPVVNTMPQPAPMIAAPVPAQPVIGQQVTTHTTVQTSGPRPSFLDVIEDSVNRLAGPSAAAPSPQPSALAPMPPSPAMAPTYTQPAPVMMPAPQAELQVMPPVTTPQPAPSPVVPAPVIAAPRIAPAPIIQQPGQNVVLPPVSPAPTTATIETVSTTKTVTPNTSEIILAEPLNPAPAESLAMQQPEPSPIRAEDIDWRQAISVTPAPQQQDSLADFDPTPAPQEPATPSPSEVVAVIPAKPDLEDTMKHAEDESQSQDWRQAISVTPPQAAVNNPPLENQENYQPGLSSEPIGREDNRMPLNITQANAPTETVTNIETISLQDLDIEQQDSPVITQNKVVKNTRIIRLTDEDLSGERPLEDIVLNTPSDVPVPAENQLALVSAPAPVSAPVSAPTPQPETLTDSLSISKFQYQPMDNAAAETVQVAAAPNVATIETVQVKAPQPVSIEPVIAEPLASNIQPIENDIESLERNQVIVEPAEPVVADTNVITVEKPQVAAEPLDQPVALQENLSIAQFNSQTSMPINSEPQKATPSNINIVAVDTPEMPAASPENSAPRGYQNMDTEIAVVKSMSGPYEYNKTATSNVESISIDDLKTLDDLENSPFETGALGTPPQIEINAPAGRAPAPAFNAGGNAPAISGPELAIIEAQTMKLSKDAPPEVEVTSQTRIEKTTTIEAVTAAPVATVSAEPLETAQPSVTAIEDAPAPEAEELAAAPTIDPAPLDTVITAESTLQEPMAEPTEQNPEPAVEQEIETAFFMPTLDDMSLVYNGAEKDLSDDLKQQLSPVVSQMKDDANMRLQLRSYAASTDGSESSARRISLARAIELRKYMLDQGIDATRIDVRALGNLTDTTPANRIDMVETK